MAEERNDAQERTEQATPKRREDARRRGQVPRSRELTTSAMLLLGGAALVTLGPAVLDRLADIMRREFAVFGQPRPLEGLLWGELTGAMRDALLALAPLLGVSALIAFLAPLALGGWAVSSTQVAFQWQRIDPIKGLGRIFSWRGLMELVKALAKFLLITTVAALILWQVRDAVLGLAAEGLEPGLRDAGWLVSLAFLLLCAATLLVAAIDVPFQLWSYGRQLRMTRQELKDELKHTEGHPEIKSRIRSLQREVASRRMMEEVPKADVVVTNPAHYAVALRYDPARMAAPRVVAKGLGPVAARIRELAVAHGVAVLRAPALARAVYHSTEIDREIPVGLYKAVAQVLAWAYRLREGGAGGWPDPVPEDLEIPDDLQVGAADEPSPGRGGA